MQAVRPEPVFMDPSCSMFVDEDSDGYCVNPLSVYLESFSEDDDESQRSAATLSDKELFDERMLVTPAAVQHGIQDEEVLSDPIVYDFMGRSGGCVLESSYVHDWWMRRRSHSEGECCFSDMEQSALTDCFALLGEDVHRGVHFTSTTFDRIEAIPSVHGALVRSGENFGFRHREYIRAHVLGDIGACAILRRSFLLEPGSQPEMELQEREAMEDAEREQRYAEFVSCVFVGSADSMLLAERLLARVEAVHGGGESGWRREFTGNRGIGLPGWVSRRLGGAAPRALRVVCREQADLVEAGPWSSDSNEIYSYYSEDEE